MVVGAKGSSSDPPSGIQSATWTTAPSRFRGSDGKAITYRCPAGGTPHDVWGSGPYTDDSSVCTAAVHAGVITLDKGGTVRVEMRPGQQSYQASGAHGIRTGSWGPFGGSFVVVGSGEEEN